MCIVALFIIAQTGNNPTSLNGWMNKQLRYIHATGYYSTVSGTKLIFESQMHYAKEKKKGRPES